jgi:DNA-binding CsgD family transcriptional regulator
MTLRERDIRAAESLVVDLAEVEDTQMYAERAVHGLLDLIPTDLGFSFTELRQEPIARRFSFNQPQTDSRPDATEAMGAHWRQSPTSSVNVGTDGGVFRWSDLIDRRDLQSLEFYQEVCLPRQERHTAKVVFPGGPFDSDAFMLVRARDDFTDRDMDVLRFLYPLLLLGYRTVKSRERAARMERQLFSRGLGMVLLRHDRVEDQLGAAADMLSDWFGPHDGTLPPEVSSWLRGTEASRPLILELPDKRLSVTRVPSRGAGQPDELLLEERQSLGSATVARSLGLTPREIEVLELVRQGMTNREIAEALFLAPTTIRRHLENVFSKLDVRTRTGAVAKAFPGPPAQ